METRTGARDPLPVAVISPESPLVTGGQGWEGDNCLTEHSHHGQISGCCEARANCPTHRPAQPPRSLATPSPAPSSGPGSCQGSRAGPAYRAEGWWTEATPVLLAVDEETGPGGPGPTRQTRYPSLCSAQVWGAHLASQASPNPPGATSSAFSPGETPAPLYSHGLTSCP